MYNQRFTKSERELKQIEKLEKNELNSNDDELHSSENSNKKQISLYSNLKIDKEVAISSININQTPFEYNNKIAENEGS